MTGLYPRLAVPLRLISALAAISLLAPQEARAQNVLSDFFGGIFGGGNHIIHLPAPQRSRASEGSRARRMMPRSLSREQDYAPRHNWRDDDEELRRPARHRPPPEAPVERKDAQPAVEANFFVAVMGDTLGQLLAQGITEDFAETPQIAVLRKGKESSGLVRDDFYDWAKAAKEIAGDARKPNVAVMMIGSNDRQPLSENGQTLEPLSPRWREIYAARVETVAAAFKEKNISLIWVGLPVMKAERFSADMAQINDIFRSASSKTGAIFIDVWDKFADEHGQYSAFGPDVKGQVAKLRSADGVNFTQTGALKLAHFVEGEIKRLYDLKSAPPPSTNSAAPAAAERAPPPAPLVFKPPGEAPPAAAPNLPADRPPVGAPQPLATRAVAGDDLARRNKANGGLSPQRAIAAHVFFEGGDLPPRPGRADDFTFSAPAKSP